jgi:hypothetical protein
MLMDCRKPMEIKDNGNIDINGTTDSFILQVPIYVDKGASSTIYGLQMIVF